MSPDVTRLLSMRLGEVFAASLVQGGIDRHVLAGKDGVVEAVILIATKDDAQKLATAFDEWSVQWEAEKVAEEGRMMDLIMSVVHKTDEAK